MHDHQEKHDSVSCNGAIELSPPPPTLYSVQDQLEVLIGRFMGIPGDSFLEPMYYKESVSCIMCGKVDLH